MSTTTVQPGATSAPGRVINLDEMRVARLEALGEPVGLVFGGRTFMLPVECPADYAHFSALGEWREAVYVLLGDDQADAFFALRPSVDDARELARAVRAAYGVDEGNSSASDDS